MPCAMRTHPDLDRKIGAAMRRLRRRRSIPASEVAASMGYGRAGRQQIYRWERGERGIGGARLLLYLRAVGATFAELDEVLGLERQSNPRLQEIARQLESLGTKS